MALNSRANFTTKGLAVGQNNVNMVALYGLSDFFHTIFEDSETVNLMLEAEAEYASDVYSRFLQLSSTLSLESIQETVGSSMKLVLLQASNQVQGAENTYTLPTSIQSARYIANRPFLPTTLWEQNVDFSIQTSTAGQLQIIFARDITTAGFPVRTDSSGDTLYALWFVDSNIDEELISKYYGDLIQISPEASTDNFYNLVYGLYYMYTQGPKLALIQSGLNLVLGIPLARDNETVLDIREYLQTGEYIVITNQNQYVIPYGLPASVAVGDTVTVGEPLSSWLQVKDYEEDGNWWLNLYIPSSVIPYLPPGQDNRYATEGSQFYYLMQNYLKTHTFLINIQVDNFKDIQNFTTVFDVIQRVKPTYTKAIYIWSVQGLDETLTLDDDSFSIDVFQARCEHLTQPIQEFYRGNTINPVMRDCPNFLRWNVPEFVTAIGGSNTYINSFQPVLDIGPVNGLRFPRGQFTTPNEIEQAWIQNLWRRNSELWAVNRSVAGYNRGAMPQNSLSGTPVNCLGLTEGMYAVPLYITSQADIQDKCTAVGADVPSLDQWTFVIPSLTNSQAINTFAIDDSATIDTYTTLTDNYDTLFFRGPTVYYLGAHIPDLALTDTYAPNIDEIQQNDYIMGVRIEDVYVGIYWVTTNVSLDMPYCDPVPENDSLEVTWTAPMNRGFAGSGTPYYLIRGQNYADGAPVGTYTDENNNAVPIDRSGTRMITHAIYRN
jgi:hypothetical protein